MPTRSEPWRVVRLDDNGNRFVVALCETRDEAQGLADELAAGGHKQTYWIERGAVDATVVDEDRSGARGEPGGR